MEYKTVNAVFGVNPNDEGFSDCWLRNSNNKAMVNPYTKENLLDYEKLKLRFTSEKYKLDLDVKKGLFIEKTVLASFITAYSRQLNMFMSLIPTKTFSLLQAEIEQITGEEMNVDKIVSLKTTLKNVHKNTCKAIQEEYESFSNKGFTIEELLSERAKAK